MLYFNLKYYRNYLNAMHSQKNIADKEIEISLSSFKPQSEHGSVPSSRLASSPCSGNHGAEKGVV